MKKLEFLIRILLFAALLAAPASAQNHTENKSDQTLRGSGRVNPSTLGAEFEVPLAAYPGRGISLPIGLSYSSKVWRMNYVASQPAVNNPDNCISINTPRFADNSAGGWTSSLSVAYIEYTGEDNPYDAEGRAVSAESGNCQPSPPHAPQPPQFRVKRINVHLSGGKTHELRDETAFATGTFPTSFDGVYYAVDGSNLKYVQDSAAGTFRLFLPDGSSYEFKSSTESLSFATVRKTKSFADRFGNTISYNEISDSWTDTIGRNIKPPVGLVTPAAPGVTTYTLPGTTGVYRLHWKLLKGATPSESAIFDFNTSLKYWSDKYVANNQFHTRAPGSYLFGSIDSRFAVGLNQLFNPVLLAAIELPTGLSYEFRYDSFGRMNRIQYPTGGTEELTYDLVPQFAYTEAGDINAQTNFGVVSRKVFPVGGQSNHYLWEYQAASGASNSYIVTVNNPDGTKAVRYHHRSSPDQAIAFGYESALAGMIFREDAISSGGQLVSQKITHWSVTQFENGGHYPKDWHPRIVSEETRIFDQQNQGVSTTIVNEYEGDLTRRDAPVLVKRSVQFPFVAVGGALPVNPVRSSEMTYLINDSRIPEADRELYRAKHLIGLKTVSLMRDSANRIVARSENIFDESGFSPARGLGNSTTFRVWDSTKGESDNQNAYVETRARFDQYGNTTETIDARGNSTITEFDPVYHAFATRTVTSVPDPTGENGSDTELISTATYDPITGLQLSSTDPNGLETRLEYDPVTLRQRYSRMFYGGEQVGGISELRYCDVSGAISVTTRNQIDSGKWDEKISYLDGLGRAYKTEKISADGNVIIEKELNEDGRIRRISSPHRAGADKAWTTYTYDETGRVKEIISPDGAKVTTDWGVLISDIVGTTKTVVDEAGKKRRGISDALGRMIRVIEDPDGQNLQTNYIFDAAGHIRQTIQGEQSRYFAFDSNGRLIYSKQPEIDSNAAFSFIDPVTGNGSWSTRYEYDDNGNLLRMTDARGVAVTGTYDSLNRMTKRQYSDSTPPVSFFYDGVFLDVSGQSRLAAGPARGRLTGVWSNVSSSGQTAFDALGRPLSSQQITDGRTFEFSYRYNMTALVEETYPSGRRISYELDDDGELRRVAGATNAGAKTYANSFKFAASGELESLRLGNGRWESLQYNARRQVTQMTLGSSAGNGGLLTLDFGYGDSANNNGSLRSQRISFDGLTNSFEQSYSYDDLNRLQKAQERSAGSLIWRQRFSYDRYGNRRFDDNGTTTLSPAVSSKVSNPQVETADNRLRRDQDGDGLGDYLFDRNGNLVADAENQRFGYDGENRLNQFFRSSNNSTAPDGVYLYDGNGNRIKKVTATENTIFVYNAAGKLACEYSTSLSPAPATSYLTTDYLGSPRVITDGLGRILARKDYSAFGEETISSGRTAGLGYRTEHIRQGYTGHERDDESGLEYAQARYYSAGQGRFTSVDPLTASADPRNPQTFNRYSYALNSPYKFVDPLGLISSSTGACGDACGNGQYGGGYSENYIKELGIEDLRNPVTEPDEIRVMIMIIRRLWIYLNGIRVELELPAKLCAEFQKIAEEFEKLQAAYLINRKNAIKFGKDVAASLEQARIASMSSWERFYEDFFGSTAPPAQQVTVTDGGQVVVPTEWSNTTQSSTSNTVNAEKGPVSGSRETNTTSSQTANLKSTVANLAAAANSQRQLIEKLSLIGPGNLYAKPGVAGTKFKVVGSNKTVVIPRSGFDEIFKQIMQAALGSANARF